MSYLCGSVLRSPCGAFLGSLAWVLLLAMQAALADGALGVPTEITPGPNGLGQCLGDCGGSWTCPAAGLLVYPSHPFHPATGYPDLDRAVGICDAHEAAGSVDPHSTYLPGYEACSRVMAKRATTEQAQREEEARVREKTDRAFLADFVGRMK